MYDRRKLKWNDIKRIIELKTFYIVLTLFLVGVICLILEYVFLAKNANFSSKGIFSSLGITFITSSTVSLIMEIFLRFDIVDFMSKRILSVMPEDISGNTGVQEFYLDRKRVDFREKWDRSVSFMKIIGISANDVLASANLPLIKKKLEGDKDFFIQILLLCPWSITAEIRANASVYKTKHECINRTHAVIMDIENFCENIKEHGIDSSRVSLKLYDDIPSLSMVIDKNSAIVAPFMVVEQGGSSPYYIAKNIDTEKCLYGTYCDHFNTIWENATCVNSEVVFDSIYIDQKDKDKIRIDSIPDKYNDWVLSINKVDRRSH